MLIQRQYYVQSDEGYRLDMLFGAALLDKTIRERLVAKRDQSLLAEYGLSDETKDRVLSAQAGSLKELARELAYSF